MDYGARMYDGQVGRFFTQDRYTSKYFSLSPYQYAANDPIKNIDINGDSIWVNVSEAERYYYENGKLYHPDGKVYKRKGMDEFSKKILDGLNEIQSGDFGKMWLGVMQEMNENVDIFKTNALAEDGSGDNYSEKNKIYINTDASSPSLPTDDGMKQGSLMITIAHELGHAFRSAKGIQDLHVWYQTPGGSLISKDELYASMYENYIRNEHSLPLRTHYSTIQGWKGFARYGESNDPQSSLFKSITPISLSDKIREPDIISYEYIQFVTPRKN